MDWESKHFNAALFAALLIIEAELKRLHHMENIACERQGAADDQRKDGRHMTLGGFRRKRWTSVANQGIDRAPSVGGARCRGISNARPSSPRKGSESDPIHSSS
jgi:hypothetical protein